MPMTPSQQKLLKTVHLVCVSVWLTGVLLLGLLPWQVGATTSDEGIRMFVSLYRFIDLQVLTPAAVATLLTGLLYSGFTTWGFARHGWILLKWAVTALLVIWGTVHLGPSVEALWAWSRSGQTQLATDPILHQGLRLGVAAAIFNASLLLLAVTVSVFKPWKNLKLRRTSGPNAS